MKITCLTPDCGSENIFCRGLCKPCYYCAIGLITRKETTWKELVERCLAAKCKRRGPKPGQLKKALIASRSNDDAHQPPVGTNPSVAGNAATDFFA